MAPTWQSRPETRDLGEQPMKTSVTRFAWTIAIIAASMLGCAENHSPTADGGTCSFDPSVVAFDCRTVCDNYRTWGEACTEDPARLLTDEQCLGECAATDASPDARASWACFEDHATCDGWTGCYAECCSSPPCT